MHLANLSKHLCSDANARARLDVPKLKTREMSQSTNLRSTCVEVPLSFLLGGGMDMVEKLSANAFAQGNTVWTRYVDSFWQGHLDGRTGAKGL